MSLAGTTDALVAEVLSESPRYPSGTMFVDAESASLPSVLDAIREERVFVIVLPDRTEVECAPSMDLLARLRRRLWWPLLRWRAQAESQLVVEQCADGYDISPPAGFRLRLHHPTAPRPS